VIIDEGEELEFEGSEEEFEEEDIVQRDEDSDAEGWEDVDSGDDDQMKDSTAKPAKKEIWDDTKEPLQEGEELVYDSSAYQMLHRAKVEWPCLSLDVLLRDRVGNKNYGSWFP
jgi:ribosome assembly protein RRB1